MWLSEGERDDAADGLVAASDARKLIMRAADNRE